MPLIWTARRPGGPMNREVIKRLCGLPLFTEAGGGMRTEADVENTLALGVDRVILGTVAVTDFGLVKRLAKRYGDRLAVGVDARDGLVATHGWRETKRAERRGFLPKGAGSGHQYRDLHGYQPGWTAAGNEP